MISRRISFPLLLALALTGGGLLTVKGADTVSPTTTSSDLYSEVSCTTTNPALCTDVLQLAADTRQQLAPLLKLGKNWRFPVHIRIVTPEDPLAAKVDQEGVTVLPGNSVPTLTVILPSSDPDARNFIQSQFVTVLLWEKFFGPNQVFDTHTRLDVVPLWLIEGLSESLRDDPEHTRESIVKRAVMGKRAPSLDDVVGWRLLSDDRLVALWQRTFCYYLLESLTRTNAQRADFQDWIASISSPHPSSARLLFPTETGWQRELLASPARSRDLVYSWDETVAELSATETIAIPAKEDADSRICTFDTVLSFPRDKKLIDAVRQKVLDLTSLQLRAHPSWQPILDLYRAGLTLLAEDKTLDQARKLIVEAQRRRAAEMSNHQKLLDYVNWFEVTKNYASNSTHFRVYFITSRQMERVQADPSHPNPIRANLLHIESQL